MTEPLPVVEPQRLPFIPRPIDNTALAMYDECERKYYYGMVLNRRRKGAEGPALVYGTAWHKMMEVHYKTGGDADAVTAGLIHAWKDHGNPDDHRTLERALTAYEAYVKLYGLPEAEARGWGRTVGYPENPVVELAVEVWWEGALHPYTGKIDRIVEHQGLYYIEDHKTTSQLGDQYFRQFDPSNQMMGYCWIGQQVTGLPIAGVRINAHGVLKSQNKFARSTIHYSPDRLREWAENLNVRVSRINDSHARLEAGRLPDGTVPDAVLLDAFPHQYGACSAKYGHCTYADVCTFDRRLRNRILEREFEVREWNPLLEELENG